MHTTRYPEYHGFEASVLVCKVDLIFALNEVRLNEKTILDYWAWVKITA